MRLRSKLTVVLSWLLFVSLSWGTFATVSQTIKYNFKATAESSVAWWEDVVHPSDDASLSEVVVTTWWWSLTTLTSWWSPIFGATAFAANGETIPDAWAMLLPYAEYGLQSTFSNWLPAYLDYNAEFFLTWIYFPTSLTNWIDAFDAWVLNSNWVSQTVFNPAAPPSANILLTWLNPAKVYNFKIAGSLDSAAAWFLVWTTVFAVWTPQNNVMINTKWNTSHYATFANVVPNAQWEVALWANAAWNPGGYIGILWGIQVIESDSTDVPSILFWSDTLTVLAPATSTSVVAWTSVGGWASIIEHRWRQVKWPVQATIVSQTSASTDITWLTKLWVYEFELSVLADNGIEERKTLRIVVDSWNWTKRTITNTNPLANDWQDIQYLEYLPDDYNTTWCENKNYPVIIYLHGFGQNGTDTEILKWEWLGYLVDQWLTSLQFTWLGWETEKFIAIIPQLATGGPWDSDDIDAVIAHILSGTQYRADYNRVYIDWFSYGSLGLWNYLWTPNKADAFAASVNSAYVPTWAPAYCNATWLPIFAMSEADMLGAWYYISSPDDFTGFMANLWSCPMNPAVIWQIMTWRDHVEMYHFYWQTDYTGFEWKNIYNWFLGHERNYASWWAWQSCFTYSPGLDLIISPSVQTVLPSDTATFTVTVINTWNSDLTWLMITSDTVPNCNISIPYLAFWTSTWFTCDITNVNAWFLNTLTATWYAYSGWISYMSNSDTQISSATVNVASFVPALQIVQTPSILNLQSWDNASIFLVITNTWDVDLSWVVVANPTMPACDTTIGYLAVWASTWYNCTLNSIIATFTTTTYTSWYAFSGGNILLWYPTSTSASSDVIVSTITPVFNPLITISISPSSQTITAWWNASFTVTVTNSWDSDLTWVNVFNPTVPGCDIVIWYLPIWSVAGYSCQANALTTSFVTTMYTSWYVYSGSVDYTWSVTNAADNAFVTVNPIIITPPPRHWWFGWGWMWTYYNPTTLSTLPQTQTTTTLSDLPKTQPKPKPVKSEPTVIVEYPAWTNSTYPPYTTPWTPSYSSSSNGTDEYRLPYASLRQLLSSLVQ